MQGVKSIVSQAILIVALLPGYSGASGVLAISGKMNMASIVVETACSMGASSTEQNVVMGDISLGEIIRSGISDDHPFSINLENCSVAGPESPVSNKTAFQITFDGPADGNNFAFDGNTRGISLQIRDDRGYFARPGVPMPPHPIPSGSHTLKYHLRAVGNGEILTSGSHSSSLRYRLDYY